MVIGNRVFGVEDCYAGLPAMLHVHHSTLQERLTWLSGQLGYSPTKGRGRQRAAITLLLWRVAHGTDRQVVDDPH